MNETAPAADGAGAPDDPRIVVVVVRTGGIAGIRRHWQAEPARDESAGWIELIEGCPWDEPCPEDAGADRFIWSIRARTPESLHERELPESALDGPWRRLVDAVREAHDDDR